MLQICEVMAEPPLKKARMEAGNSENLLKDDQYNSSQDMFANSMEEEEIDDNGRLDQNNLL